VFVTGHRPLVEISIVYKTALSHPVGSNTGEGRHSPTRGTSDPAPRQDTPKYGGFVRLITTPQMSWTLLTRGGGEAAVNNELMMYTAALHGDRLFRLLPEQLSRSLGLLNVSISQLDGGANDNMILFFYMGCPGSFRPCITPTRRVIC
jgi:hypothetical protein